MGTLVTAVSMTLVAVALANVGLVVVIYLLFRLAMGADPAEALRSSRGGISSLLPKFGKKRLRHFVNSDEAEWRREQEEQMGDE